MKIYNIHTTYELIREDKSTTLLDSPEAVTKYMAGAFDQHPDQESFWTIILDRKNKPRGRQLITLGTQTSSLVHPREVFRTAVREGAAAIILCHNHPSGDPTPSSADIRVTRQLKEASETLGIELLDHVIIGDTHSDPNGEGFYSFNDNGLL